MYIVIAHLLPHPQLVCHRVVAVVVVAVGGHAVPVEILNFEIIYFFMRSGNGVCVTSKN